MVHNYSSHFVLIAFFEVLLSVLVVTQRYTSSDGSYQQILLFPPIRGEIQGLTQYGNNPAVQTTAGFRLNSPPPLSVPFIPPPDPFQRDFSLQRPQGASFRSLLPRPFPPGVNLFLPNTIKQPVESRAQFEEYKKYLKEAAEEDETEKNLNIVGIDDKGDVLRSDVENETPTTNSFVKLHVEGKDYSYSS